MKRSFPAMVAALALAGLQAPARADEPQGAPLGEPLWEAGLGVAGLRMPHYRGSNQSTSWWLPVPFFVYRGEFLRSDRDGTRAVIVDEQRFDLDLSFSASAPVDSEHDAARAGMADLSPTVEVGPKLSVELAKGPGWAWAVRAPVRAVISLHAPRRVLGWSATPSLNFDQRLPWADLGLQAGPQWGDARLHSVYYGVPLAQANEQRPAYEARGGFAGWQATAALSRRVEQVWVGAFLRYDSVAGAVFERSPLVTARDQVSFGLAVSWIFAESSERSAERH